MTRLIKCAHGSVVRAFLERNTPICSALAIAENDPVSAVNSERLP
jgi:hypothetical protein